MSIQEQWQFLGIDEIEARSLADDVLFNELHDVLARHGALRRFGITLLHQHFSLDPGEVMLETTDIASRTQTLRPMSEEQLHAMEFIETAWSLESGAPIMRCTCQKYDGRHLHGESN